jgi:hypothetical protein
MADYGSGDPLEPDPAVAVYALRTFRVEDGQLASIITGTGHWIDGTCIARCTQNPDHVAPPVDGCQCGIYGAHTLAALRHQYAEKASRLVCVIAAEGATVIGATGLRTAAARIVAFWTAEPNGSQSEFGVARQQCPGARRYFDVDLMAKLYGLTT